MGGEPTSGENAIQLLEIEKNVKNRVAQAVGNGEETPVANPSAIKRSVKIRGWLWLPQRAHEDVSIACAARRPL